MVPVIPEEELVWSFARSGGPGGQNVNKVASKAVLHWNLAANTSLPSAMKARLQIQQRGRLTTEGVMVIMSDRYRDQPKNIEDCRAKLHAMLLAALHPPKPRKATKPTRGSKLRRLDTKKRQSQRKQDRRGPTGE